MHSDNICLTPEISPLKEASKGRPKAFTETSCNDAKVESCIPSESKVEIIVENEQYSDIIPLQTTSAKSGMEEEQLSYKWSASLSFSPQLTSTEDTCEGKNQTFEDMVLVSNEEESSYYTAIKVHQKLSFQDLPIQPGQFQIKSKKCKKPAYQREMEKALAEGTQKEERGRKGHNIVKSVWSALKKYTRDNKGKLESFLDKEHKEHPEKENSELAKIVTEFVKRSKPTSYEMISKINHEHERTIKYWLIEFVETTEFINKYLPESKKTKPKTRENYEKHWDFLKTQIINAARKSRQPPSEESSYQTTEISKII